MGMAGIAIKKPCGWSVPQDGVRLALVLQKAGGGAAAPLASLSPAQLAAALREFERERTARVGPITKKSYNMGWLLQLPYSPVRDPFQNSFLCHSLALPFPCSLSESCPNPHVTPALLSLVRSFLHRVVARLLSLHPQASAVTSSLMGRWLLILMREWPSCHARMPSQS
jgi:hypothetical protein